MHNNFSIYDNCNDYRYNEGYDAFTVFFNAVSMFVGCAWAHGYRLVCYFGPSEYNKTDNVLYSIGDPCTECLDKDKCSKKFPNLCGKYQSFYRTMASSRL